MLLLALWWCLGSGLVIADLPVSPDTATPVLSAEEIKAKINETEASEGLAEAVKAKAVESYRRALTLLETARSYADATAEYVKARSSAPQRAQQIRDELESGRSEKPTLREMGIGPNTALAEIEQRLIKEQANLAALEAKADDLGKQLDEQLGRPEAARQRLTETKKIQQEIETELELPPPDNEAPVVTDARQRALLARQKKISAEIDMLDQEMLSQPMRVDLLRAQRDLAAKSLSRVTARVRLLEDLVNERRRTEAERAHAEAAAVSREAAGKYPAIRQLAQRNAALGKEIAAMAQELEGVTSRKDAVEARRKQLEKDFQGAREKLEIAGLSQSLSRVLIDLRRQLPDARMYRKNARQREKTIAELGLKEVRHTEERAALDDLDSAADAVLADLAASDVSGQEQSRIRDEVRKLLKDRRNLLDKTLTTETAYLRALNELDFVERRLLDDARTHDAFLNEHLLWIPSDLAVDLGDVRDLPAATVWLLSAEGWQEVISTLAREAREWAFFTATVVIISGALLLGRRRINAALLASGRKVGEPYTDRFGYTMQAIGYTALLAIPWPLLLTSIALLLTSPLDNPPFVDAAGRACEVIAPTYLNLLGFYLLCMPGGVADAHFRWSAPVLKLLRAELMRLMLILLPAGFVAVMVGNQPNDDYVTSLSRVAFVVLMGSLGFFFYRIMHPRTGAPNAHLAAYPEGLVSRLRHVWYPLAFGTPLALAALSLLGYYYTAAQLTRSLIDTLWLLLGVLIARDLVVRWLAIAHRKLAIKHAREQWEAARAAARKQEQAGVSDESGPVKLEIPEVDLDLVDAQTRKLLHTILFLSSLVGLWVIWAEVLPALSFLNTISLWQHLAVVGGEEKLVPITLGNIGLATVIAIITAVTARNFPGVLEIAVLRHLTLTPGARYTISTMSRYIIVAIGIILVFNAVGGNWSQIQWLVAALGVGLGFGLQEIFGNFISGLIILFERPVRVGDTVTVGNITGTISRIQIRATTITDWDRKEILVPNKSFITEQVINWTLTDPITRLLIHVGIAYGSDTTLAHRVMLDAVRAIPLVRTEPAPSVFFMGFGDSSLDFEVRVFVSKLDERLPITHEVHMAIERALRENGIVIPFPQRDVHIIQNPD
jgi:potassium efflux system protein